MKHHTVTFRPESKVISIHSGATILEAASQLGIILNTSCGATGSCKKCAVTLLPDETEVLACQHKITSDLQVRIPVTSKLFEKKILVHGVQGSIDISPPIFDKFPNLLDPSVPACGIALDIGTTTVVTKLIDLRDGTDLAIEAVSNPQAAYGDDVISRILHASTPDGQSELQSLIVNCINSLIAKLCNATDIKPEEIYALTAAGNTTMTHLLLGYPVKQLGQAPYLPHSLEACDRTAEDMRININPAGNIHVPPNIASFIGSDITAAAVAVELGQNGKTTLLVDIGTNSEVLLYVDEKLYAVSCAAGPAFEGAKISQGSRAIEGAIEAVVINDNDIDIDIIGQQNDIPARSICGSGLVDAVAVMLDLGIIEKTGRFTDPPDLPEAIQNRIVTKDSLPAFVLAHGTGDNDSVMLTQRDIREAQLAKAAIRAGIAFMLKTVGITDESIEDILMAGAFGNYIRRESALRIGMLPDVHIENIHFVGNAANSGAEMILLSKACRLTAKEIARNVEFVETASQPQFQNIFADSLMFPAPKR